MKGKRFVQERLRVIHLVDSLRVGGKERQVIELLKGLKISESVDSVVVTMGEEQFYVPDVVKLQVPLVYLIRRIRWDPCMFWRLFRVLRKYRPHIINTNSTMAMFYAWPLAKLLRIKLIDATIRNAISGKGARWQLHRLMCCLADARIANSKAGFASRGWSEDAPGNYVIYNGFDLRRFETQALACGSPAALEPRGRKVVGMIAEFSDYKDYPTFIRAAQIILSRRKDVLFIAIGGGKNLERCKQLISPVEEGFRFLGERKDVEGLVAQLDIGVLCTFTEGISNSVMEYMAAGKPVVVTDGGGSRELVVNEQTGFLIPPKDANAVAEKIELLLDNHNLAIRLGAAGKRRIIREFSLEQLAARTVTAFKNVILKGTEYPRRLVTEHV